MTLETSGPNVGDVHREVVVDDLTRTQIVQYSGASGDYNPLHSDEIFATQVAGFPGIFAHGMLTMGMTGKMVTNYVGDGRLRSFGGRFRAQVWPGDTLTAQAEVVDIRNDDDGVGVVELRITTTNQDGLEVFASQATATIG
ncbi:MAG TPA: MaoC/PaaZ C-terminal domain-containing protein [Acidimicrobiales bacterium]